jgi:hypothetical protein
MMMDGREGGEGRLERESRRWKWKWKWKSGADVLFPEQ